MTKGIQTGDDHVDAEEVGGAATTSQNAASGSKDHLKETSGVKDTFGL